MERSFPLYKTPHPFRRNERTVLKRFVAEKRSQNDSSQNKMMKNDSRPFAAPSHLAAAAHLRRCCYSFVSCTYISCHLLKAETTNPPRSYGYTARLIVYADRAIICLLCNRFSSVLSEGSVFYTIVFPLFYQKAVKQTKRIIRLNNLTFQYKQKRNETKR